MKNNSNLFIKRQLSVFTCKNICHTKQNLCSNLLSEDKFLDLILFPGEMIVVDYSEYLTVNNLHLFD